jgi:hypothetical protein
MMAQEEYWYQAATEAEAADAEATLLVMAGNVVGKRMLAIAEEADGGRVTKEQAVALTHTFQLPGSDMTWFAWRGVPLLCCTKPKVTRVGKFRVHCVFRHGQLPPPSPETLRECKVF